VTTSADFASLLNPILPFSVGVDFFIRVASLLGPTETRIHAESGKTCVLAYARTGQRQSCEGVLKEGKAGQRLRAACLLAPGAKEYLGALPGPPKRSGVLVILKGGLPAPRSGREPPPAGARRPCRP
jgi:hypothetical protein